MSVEKKYRQAVTLYEAALIEADMDEAAESFQEALALLGELTEPGTDYADVFHLLGMCRYNPPDGIENDPEKAEAAFQAALAIDPAHQYANLYLGHVLFDTGRYAEARERFEQIDPAYFTARRQVWRILKNDELILCCHLETEPASVTDGAIDTLCQRYETTPEEDRVVPKEIVESLDRHITDGLFPEKAQARARRLLTMLERTDWLDARHFQEVTGRLKAAAFQE